MAGKVLFESTKLYNILNQYDRQSRLAESNYLCLIDARPAKSYTFSHIITARNAKWDSEGKFIMPTDVEIESIRYIIVYDSSTHSLLDSGPAIDCADSLEKASRFPILILIGGYEKFSALYPFLRTQKILYTIRELESLKPYPVEILPGQLYMGDYIQATNPEILKDLKLKALVNVSDECSLMFKKANCTVLHFRIADSVEADLFLSFERMCGFIDSHLSTSSSVMIFSNHGISRCSALAMAFLMHHLKYTLKEAWNHIQQCKANMRPNRGFVRQLSNWELQTLGQRVTDISEPNY
ncbi:serine/threonine/tyrosine-interacting-like protein 1 [Triplophysa dalaica]|uniref:serine/threonine/tyrosine-interacting-like protein 1 n=1 Tax=Triplophysa dalaica TaxID=1582913 RepID=UPI0024E00A83|nr:serine/threonine/tyrosine-interacting-like protein 1 [Triplophysa dalaica]